MKKLRIHLLLAFMLLGPSPVASWACSCAATPPPRAKFHRSALVFTGRVSSLQTATARVEVERVWKGQPPKKITIRLGAGECTAMGFVKGRFYLFYLPRLHGGEILGPNVCSWIYGEPKPLSDLKWLRKLKSRKA